MRTDGMTVTQLEEPNPVAGDIIKIDGKRHKVLKSTGRTIAAQRWYWWDVAFAWLFSRLERP